MTGTSDNREGGRRHRRYLAEFVVIFLGVSLSFLAENLREARADRAAERESLIRLVRGMESDLADFPGNMERAQAGMQAIAWIQAARNGAPPARDSLEHYIDQTLVCSEMHANASEYESLKGSGTLRIIRDMEFRQALTANYEQYPFLSELHFIDCESQLDALAHVANEIRIDPDFTVHITGDVEELMSNGRFFHALAGIQGRRGAIVGSNRARIQALKELQGRAIELLDQR